MRAITTTNDPVRLSFLTAMLAGAGIVAYVLDTHASIIEGSVGAIPRRIVVADEDYALARQIVQDVEDA